MINLKPTNEKLRRRVFSIVKELTGLEAEESLPYLEKHDWSIRAAEEEIRAQK